ncbi:hypothetical protein FACS1894187_06430 [Synergistales bacterium]|nr:hypothetical protein FACS1894187_06430 [Synergistales bacterium]
MFFQSRNISPIIAKEVGSGFVPKIVAAVFMSLSMLLLVLTLLKERKVAAAKTNEDIKGGVLTILALIAYVFLFDGLGFLLSTALYLFVQITILSDAKNRRLPLFCVISVVTPTIIYFLFVKGFDLILPAGILPF